MPYFDWPRSRGRWFTGISAAFQGVLERRTQVLAETSRFVREDGRWFYLDGDIS